MSTVGVERARERSGPGGRSAPPFDVHAADGSRLYSVVVGEPTTRNRPQAVLFEFDNILYDATAWQRWLSQALRRMQVAGDYDTFLCAGNKPASAKSAQDAASFPTLFPNFCASVVCRLVRLAKSKRPANRGASAFSPRFVHYRRCVQLSTAWQNKV